MSDLISRQALIDRFKQLKGSDTLANMFVTDVIKEIKKQPTAYDVDKVVERMCGCECCSGCCTCFEENRMMECEEYAKIYEIVKAGGLNG